MAIRVRWAYSALEDLKSTIEYIAGQSPFYARSLNGRIFNASASLKKFARRGRIVPEFGDPFIREIFIDSYRLIYQLTGNDLVILALIHGRRDLLEAWKGRE